MARTIDASELEDYQDVTKFDAMRSASYGIQFHYEITRTAESVTHSEIVREIGGDELCRVDAPIEYSVGSGQRGRSYLINRDGKLYMSPVTWYSEGHRWDMSPSYSKENKHFERRIVDGCVFCHAGLANVNPTQEHTFGSPAFFEASIGCERCHGPGEAHVRGKGKMVNPASLAPTQRDSICLQCHLTGAMRIAQPGRGPATFRPGDHLADHLMVFIGNRANPERSATDHAEQLSRSRCQQKAGAKLWCGSCHDAHSGATRGAAACQDCHPAQHANGGPNCVACHMPKAPSREGQHVVYTDHTIARRPAQAATGGPIALRPFPGMRASERDWAIAERRRPLLEKLAARPDADAAVLVQLAQLYDEAGKGAVLYERALRQEPDHATALANLGIYRMKQGRQAEALAMWSRAFEKNPGMLSVGLNLALGRIQTGDKDGAVVTLRRVLRFHPDSERARQMLGELR